MWEHPDFLPTAEDLDEPAASSTGAGSSDPIAAIRSGPKENEAEQGRRDGEQERRDEEQ